MTVTINLYNMIYLLATWILYSIGLLCLLGKMKQPHRWMSFIPGLRVFALASAMEMDREGVICGLLELFMFVNNFLQPADNVDDRVSAIYMLAVLVAAVILIIFQIRIFLRLTLVMGVRKWWLLLWIPAPWLVMMIFGISKKYQPRNLSFVEDWEAGTRPANLSAVAAAAAADSGLTVNLRKRTARDFLKKRYLLKDISLTIPNGSLVLLLGGSGSGKTTFVNALIGYEKADATVILNGNDVYRDYAHMKYRIGFVPQQNLIRGSDTVEHTVNDAAKLRLPKSLTVSERRTRADEVMDLLGLTAGAEGLVSKKSGGQLRRISIAQELVVDPELFVLDEPDSGLDGVIAREIFTKLRSVADAGKIVIVITHTPDRVIDLFDKVIVLGRDSGRVGRLAFYGSPNEARAFFGKDTMEGIVMCVNRKEEGGEGRADEFVARYAAMTAGRSTQQSSSGQNASASENREQASETLDTVLPSDAPPDDAASFASEQKEGDPA